MSAFPIYIYRTFTKTTEKINGIRQISSDDLAVFQMECVRENSNRDETETWFHKQEMFVTATLNGCSHHTKFNQEILICGTKGNLVLRNQDLYFRKCQGNETSEEMLHSEKDPPVTSQNNNHPSSFDLNSTPEIFPKGTSLLFRHLSNTLKASSKDGIEESISADNPNDKPQNISSLASFEDGLYVQAVMEAIRQSSKEKSWSKVNVVDNFKDK